VEHREWNPGPVCNPAQKFLSGEDCRMMTKKQASEAAERWNGESEATPREPADKYEITIIVSADGAEMKVNLPGIKRENIMAPGFDRAIQVAVQNFEHFVYGQPLPAAFLPVAAKQNE
jgi:hypothetical protein